jgi:hypothetical protein
MQRIHQVGGEHEGPSLDLDEIARAGARRMLAEALEAEVRDYIATIRVMHQALKPVLASPDGLLKGV